MANLLARGITSPKTETPRAVREIFWRQREAMKPVKVVGDEEPKDGKDSREIGLHPLRRLHRLFPDHF